MYSILPVYIRLFQNSADEEIKKFLPDSISFFHSKCTPRVGGSKMRFWVALFLFLFMVPIAEAGDLALPIADSQAPEIMVASLDPLPDNPPSAPTDFRVSLDAPKPPPGSTFGLGQCHASGAGRGYLMSTWSYSAGGESAWNTIEPQRGVYNWAGLDSLINRARADKKKIWIQVLHNNPQSFAPQWAVDAGVEVVNTYYGSLPVIWGTKYREIFGGVLKAMADRYDKDEYLDVVGAVLIMGGGYYGEMAIKPQCGIGMGCQNPDVLDPNNVLVKSIAKAYGKTPQEVATSHGCTVQGRAMTCYTFDDLYIDSIQKTIDMYASTFKKLPVVIQLGTGLSFQGRVSSEVVRYANCKYADRVWTKFNGWEPGTSSGPGNWTYSRTGYEGGHYWFFSKNYWKTNNSVVCPAGSTPEQCTDYRLRWGKEMVADYVDRSIFKSNNSFLCLQSTFFDKPDEYFFSLTCPNLQDASDERLKKFCPDELDKQLKSARPPVVPPASYCAGIQ
jgi:hypothetical protein